MIPNFTTAIGRTCRPAAEPLFDGASKTRIDDIHQTMFRPAQRPERRHRAWISARRRSGPPSKGKPELAHGRFAHCTIEFSSFARRNVKGCARSKPLTCRPPKKVGWKSNERCRNPHDRQGHDAARPVPDRLLLRRVSGPGKRRLRGADDEQGPRAVAVRVRLRRRRVLSRLFHVRGAVEPVPGAGRRAQVDRPDHVHLGHALGAMALSHRPPPVAKPASTLVACCSASPKQGFFPASSSI